MRRFVPILLLLSLPACQDRTDAQKGEAAESASIPSDQDLLRGAGDPARLQALVERAMSTIPDAASARSRNVRAGAGGAACGEISLKSAPFRPFVVTPEAVAVIAAGPTLAFNDPSDLAADAWIRWCASPEELATLRPRLNDPALAPFDEANVSAGTEPLLPTALPPPGAAVEEGTQPPPPPPKKAPPPQIDSFFNSVQRSGD